MPAEKAPAPRSQEHITQLRNCRVRVDFLDIELRKTDGRGEERRRQTDDRDHVQRTMRRMQKNRRTARDHINARRHHGGGVDQRADGVGPAIASGSQTYNGICADLPVAPTNSNRAIAVIHPALDSTGIRLTLPKTVPKSSDPKWIAIKNTASEKPKSPMRFTMNALLAGVGCEFFQEVEADQQVAAQSHAFPADEQQQEIGGQHQHQHEEHE